MADCLFKTIPTSSHFLLWGSCISHIGLGISSFKVEGCAVPQIEMAGCGAARVFARNGGLPSVRLRPHSLTLHHEDLRGLGGSGFCNVMNYYNRYPNSRLEAMHRMLAKAYYITVIRITPATRLKRDAAQLGRDETRIRTP
jgi:hypothetical protein